MRDACAVVLAGGLSRRFGSDKALAELGGEPLIARAVRLLRAEFAQVLIAAKDDRYAAFGDVVRDPSPAQTPLAGLHAGLSASRCELVFACAADMPFVADRALLDALFAAVQDAAVPGQAGLLQPLAALWRRSVCLPVAAELLAAGSPGPRALAARVRAAYVEWPDARPFLDADTPEALALLAR